MVGVVGRSSTAPKAPPPTAKRNCSASGGETASLASKRISLPATSKLPVGATVSMRTSTRAGVGSVVSGAPTERARTSM